MKVWWFIKCLVEFGTVADGSVCWFSEKFFDVHDYPVNKGGNGHALHMYKYTCHKCGKEFFI